MISLRRDLHTVWQLLFPQTGGETHAERLGSFYRGQAAEYDRFRERLLPGRVELIQSLQIIDQPGLVWLDVGCGTASNLELAADRLRDDAQVVLLDLTRPLLDIARQRVHRIGLTERVRIVEADAISISQINVRPNLVTCSFSLTMMPRWWLVLDAISEVLADDGEIAVVDFYVSERHPDPGFVRHGWAARQFWRAWFERDGVVLNIDHLPTLRSQFNQSSCFEGVHKIPYLPFLRVPYYRFVGRRNSLWRSSSIC